MPDKIRVLFVCTANAARSQMAEALLRHTDPTRFEAASAGLEPTAADPRALEALAQVGVSTEHLHSKPLEEFQQQAFDYVITLCSKATADCQALQGRLASAQLMAWDFNDPQNSDDPAAFRQTLHELHERIKMFVLIMNKPRAEARRAHSSTAGTASSRAHG
ncbi:MAG: arsenate reductase ArsC [Gammaproteobacteria bacterium]|nr:arsenate reductase ArsC [Gammaproteobacteria bacterium]